MIYFRPHYVKSSTYGKSIPVFFPDFALKNIQFSRLQNDENEQYLAVFLTHCSSLPLRDTLGGFWYKQNLHGIKYQFQIHQH